jgi:hypothetical protein
LADQFSDAALPGDVDEPSHQQIADPAPFPVTADGDGVFGSDLSGSAK